MVRLSGILVLVPLARLLNPSQLGVYSLVFWLVQNGTMLGRLGVDAAMHRNGAQIYKTDPAGTGRLLSVGSTIMAISFTTLVVAIWIWRIPLAEYWLGDKDVAAWLGYAAAFLFVEGMGLILMTGLLSIHNFQANSLATCIGALGRLLLSPLLAWHYGLSGAFLGLILASCLQLGVAFVSLFTSIRLHRIPIRLQGFWQESHQILLFGLPFYAGNALISLMMLPLMGQIGRVAGVEALAQLRIGQSMSQIVNFLPGAIAPVAISVLSEAYGTEEQEFQKLRSLHLRGNWLIALTLAMFLSLASRPLVSLLFGNTYQAAVPVVIGMSWVALLTVVVENLNLYSLSAGNTKAIAVGSILQKLTFIYVTFWLTFIYAEMSFVFGLLLGGIIQFFVIFTNLLQEFEAHLKFHIMHLFLFSGICVSILYILYNFQIKNTIIYISSFFIPLVTFIVGIFYTTSIEEKTLLLNLLYTSKLSSMRKRK